MQTLSRAALFAAAAVTAAALASGAALAAEQPKPDGGSAAFVQAYGAPTAQLRQIARWNDPVCVQVTGLPADRAAAIKARVEEVAKGVGLVVAPAGCAPHIEIAFTLNAQHLIDDVAAKQEALLGYEHRNDKTLRTMSHPIEGRYVTSTMGDGGNNAGTAFAFTQSRDGQFGLPTQTRERITDDPALTPPTGCADNRFTHCLKSVFENVLVVVDLKRAASTNLGVISDYVSMLALSQPRSYASCAPLPSITDLYLDCGRPAQNGLTPADAAYLTALYTSDPEASDVIQPSDIAGRMANILAGSSVASR